MKGNAPTTGPRRDVALLLLARGLRGFGDGFAIIVLPAYLTALGLGPIAVGVVATASLLGTALLTLAVGVVAPRFDLRTLLLCGAGVMVATGLAFRRCSHVVGRRKRHPHKHRQTPGGFGRGTKWGRNFRLRVPPEGEGWTNIPCAGSATESLAFHQDGHLVG